MLRAQRAIERELAAGTPSPAAVARLSRRRARVLHRLRARRAGAARERRPRARRRSTSVSTISPPNAASQRKRIEVVQGVLASLDGTRDVMSVLEELGRETTGFFSYAGGVDAAARRRRRLHRAAAHPRPRDVRSSLSAGRAVVGDRAPDLALHRHGVLARVGRPGRAVRRRQPRRRRGRVHDGARAGADALGDRRRRPVRRGDLGRARLDGRHRADRSACSRSGSRRSACWSCRGCSR